MIATAGAATAGPFTNAELIDGFERTVFGAEVTPSAREADAAQQVKKFARPVGYHIIDRSSVDRTKALRRFLRGLGAAVENLTLAAADEADADLVIYLADRAGYAAVIRETVWDGVDTAFLEANACSAVLAAKTTGIERAAVYLVADEGFATFAHCMVEEIMQSLGPANDSSGLPDSIFNDQSQLNVFGLFDWYILNMLYDGAIQPGMSRADVRPLLPAVIARVRRRLPRVSGEVHHAISAHHGGAARRARRRTANIPVPNPLR